MGEEFIIKGVRTTRCHLEITRYPDFYISNIKAKQTLQIVYVSFVSCLYDKFLLIDLPAF